MIDGKVSIITVIFFVAFLLMFIGDLQEGDFWRAGFWFVIGTIVIRFLLIREDKENH